MQKNWKLVHWINGSKTPFPQDCLKGWEEELGEHKYQELMLHLAFTFSFNQTSYA